MKLVGNYFSPTEVSRKHTCDEICQYEVLKSCNVVLGVLNPQWPFSGSSRWSLIALIFLEEGWSPYELTLVPSTWASFWALKITVWLYSQEIQAKPFRFKGCQQRKEGKRKIMHQTPTESAHHKEGGGSRGAAMPLWSGSHPTLSGREMPTQQGNKGSGGHRCRLRLASGREGRPSFSDLCDSCS